MAEITPDPEGVIDSDYLPFTPSELIQYFANIVRGGDPERHLAYYLASAKAKRTFMDQSQVTGGNPTPQAIKRARQMEKDERFWVMTALITIFRASNRISLLAELLGRSGLLPLPATGLATWDEALSGDLQLYFEVNLPSPPAYRNYLANHFYNRTLDIPYVRAAAERAGLRPEGTTKVDAVLIAPATGFAVLFEAKVLSDISPGIQYDALRNQIIRYIDVILDANPRLDPLLAARDPNRSCLVLLTPRIFKENRRSRLYGWLFDEYTRNPQAIREDLPHRTEEDLDPVSVAQRLGWLTWEDCSEVFPEACPWLSSATIPGHASG